MRPRRPPRPAPAHLPADGVQLLNVLPHVLVHVEAVDDGVDLEGHAVVPAPPLQLPQVLHVVDLALATADQDVDVFVEAVAGDGQDVQVLA